MKKLTTNKAPIPKNTWIMTYGDMVTLLLTFFLLMIVILNEAENNIYRILNLLLDETESTLTDYIENNELSDYIEVVRNTKGVQLTLSGSDFFDINSAKIQPQLKSILTYIGKTIKRSRLVRLKEDTQFKNFYTALKKNKLNLNVEIRVEGHTDNWTIKGGKYANNWELSSARAMEVVQFLNKISGIPEKNFSALGYGEYRPVANNSTIEGRSKNRRVEIFIDADISDNKDLKIAN